MSLIENHVVSISENTSTTQLQNIASKIFFTPSPHVWTFALPRVSTVRLLSSIQIVSRNQSLVDGIFVVFDTDVNASDCRSLCLASANQTDICNPIKPGSKTFCIKLDLSAANVTTTNRIRQVLATEWKLDKTDQVSLPSVLGYLFNYSQSHKRKQYC